MIGTLFLSASLLACKKPAEAPTELSDLAGFLFEHHRDEDTAELEAGTKNLELWLQSHIDDTLEGYTVADLEESVIDSVNPGREHDLDNLGGASVGYLHPHNVGILARTLLLEEQEVVFPDAYLVHDRDYWTDTDCFMPKECDFANTDNNVEASYPLGLKVTTHTRAQYRWVNYFDEDWALIHRTWLVDQAEVSISGIEVHEQLYVGVVLPWEGGAFRIGTTWIAADIFDGVISESTALQIMIDSMSGEGEKLDAFISGDAR